MLFLFEYIWNSFLSNDAARIIVCASIGSNQIIFITQKKKEYSFETSVH